MADAISTSPAYRATFDFTVDELVDVSFRTVRETRTGRAWRRNYRLSAAASGTVCLFVLGLMEFGATATNVVATTMFGLILGSVCFALSGRVYDHQVRKRIRRLFAEQMSTAQDCTCEFELRPDGLSCHQQGLQVVRFWSNLISIDEDGSDLAFRFQDAVCVVRGRAFSTRAERQAFLEQARKLAFEAGAAARP